MLRTIQLVGLHDGAGVCGNANGLVIVAAASERKRYPARDVAVVKGGNLTEKRIRRRERDRRDRGIG